MLVARLLATWSHQRGHPVLGSCALMARWGGDGPILDLIAFHLPPVGAPWSWSCMTGCSNVTDPGSGALSSATTTSGGRVVPRIGRRPRRRRRETTKNRPLAGQPDRNILGRHPEHGPGLTRSYSPHQDLGRPPAEPIRRNREQPCAADLTVPHNGRSRDKTKRASIAQNRVIVTTVGATAVVAACQDQASCPRARVQVRSPTVTAVIP